MNSRNIDKYISIIDVYSTNFIDSKLKIYDLNKTKGIVMLYISKFDLSSQSDINEFFSMKKSAMTKIINALVKSDYVKRVNNENDKRERLITLTQKGKEIIRVIDEVLDSWTEFFIKDVNVEDLTNLEEILSKLVANVTLGQLKKGD